MMIVKGKRTEATIELKPCLVPGCDKAAAVRGVCRRCRDSQRQLARKYGLKDKHFMDMGQLLPKAKRGRKGRMPVYVSLKEKGLVE